MGEVKGGSTGEIKGACSARGARQRAHVQARPGDDAVDAAVLVEEGGQALGLAERVHAVGRADLLGGQERVLIDRGAGLGFVRGVVVRVPRTHLVEHAHLAEHRQAVRVKLLSEQRAERVVRGRVGEDGGQLGVREGDPFARKPLLGQLETLLPDLGVVDLIDLQLVLPGITAAPGQILRLLGELEQRLAAVLRGRRRAPGRRV